MKAKDHLTLKLDRAVSELLSPATSAPYLCLPPTYLPVTIATHRYMIPFVAVATCRCAISLAVARCLSPS